MHQQNLRIHHYFLLGVAGAFFAVFAFIIIRMMWFAILLLPLALFLFAV